MDTISPFAPVQTWILVLQSVDALAAELFVDCVMEELRRRRRHQRK